MNDLLNYKGYDYKFIDIDYKLKKVINNKTFTELNTVLISINNNNK